MMITVSQAIQSVHKNVQSFDATEHIPVSNAIGRTLAQDVVAPVSLPSFRQSAMDGYAVRFRESGNNNKNNTFTLIGEVKAGDAQNPSLTSGTAVRIFTGARVPDTADAVVIQELVQRKDDHIHIEKVPVVGQNIRAIGGQIQAGSCPLKKGHTLQPSSLGLLKSLGIDTVSVTRNPKVTILVTGNELVKEGNPLADGQVYESNSAVLEAVLHQRGIHEVQIVYVEDNLEKTQKILQNAIATSELVLISGGISVGDYDFVGVALQNLDVRTIFYKVLQKPGKPLFFGKQNDTYIFALPGNPASTLTCYYIYVQLAFDILSGAQYQGLLRIHLPISAAFTNTFGRALFLKARVNREGVTILDFQNSATMITFAEANALVYIPETTTEVAQGTIVETILLPYGSTQ
ncbi:gephyrin-like molybdotransferase Glp [Dokdonia ponticola]|uniref:Molybdopterin molybdenumtransferase n=1 Tax=Dokdonia ponticola TaxID=2041041 RepID=A0ABV9I2K3_9FLAO